MPSLFRFLLITGTLGACVAGGLFVLAKYYEPVPQEVTKVVPGIKIRKE